MHGRITNPGAPPGSNMPRGNTRQPLPHHFSPIDFKFILKISYDNTVYLDHPCSHYPPQGPAHFGGKDPKLFQHN
ncbi:hypothetical protein DPMN_118457 [Dreissena polymorpha]|uniref:Uncharacterized protein n=1 Tax=Dreissena polymorpha TaxID=45954 RepID=A0A9D4GN52_DREPO|nr:hypothetical protein DPMN_118457 [Dreissena polymorpha]